MIACNSHGHPPLDPDRPDLLLNLPDFYPDLMFADPPHEQAANEAATEPEPLVA